MQDFLRLLDDLSSSAAPVAKTSEEEREVSRMNRRFACIPFVALGVLMCAPVFVRADSIEDQYKAYLTQNLANKSYGFHKDDTHRVFGGKKGKEWSVDGKTGTPSITITKSGEGFDVKLIAKVTLPYDGHYVEKNFIGVSSEHPHDDVKDPRGKITFTITKTFFSITMEPPTVVDPNVPGDHDATKMSLQGIQNDVLSHLK